MSATLSSELIQSVKTLYGTHESNDSNMTDHVNDPVIVTVMSKVNTMDDGEWVTVESRKSPKRDVDEKKKSHSLLQI